MIGQWLTKSRLLVMKLVCCKLNKVNARAVKKQTLNLVLVGEGCSKRHGPFEGRLDADPARARAYIAATAQAANMYHDLMYGEHQIRLKLLATRPEYQRQGAASKLLDWGMCLSREKLKVLTVLAGPMGRKLYTKTCFYEQGTVDVQVDGEDEKATFSAMVCNSI